MAISLRSDKYSRIFQRMVTGLQIAKNQEAFMRFMTLTTARRVLRPIENSFNLLKMRIQRATYKKDGFKGFKFNRYFKLRTSEGFGVLHIIYWGRFIPQNWLSKNWHNIHGAKIVDIRKCYSRRRKVNGLVGYLLSRYLQRQPIERMSYGWKWAWLGFCKSWVKIKEIYGQMKRSQISSMRLLSTYIIQLKTHWNNGFYTKTTFSAPKYNFQGLFSNQSVRAWQTILWQPPSTTRMTKIDKFV